jgi:hypothetical protein
MKVYSLFCLLLLLFSSHSSFSQQTFSRYAAKNARTTLQWPGISSQNETCGIQLIPASNQFNLVIYPSGFAWSDPNQRNAFLTEYMDESNHKSAHFDGVFTLQGEQNLEIVGLRNVTCQGNWTWKGISIPGSINGTIDVIRPGEIRFNLTSGISLDQFGIQPSNRALLDLPNNTQVQITGFIPGMP